MTVYLFVAIKIAFEQFTFKALIVFEHIKCENLS